LIKTSAACRYELVAKDERLDVVADLVIDTAMLPPEVFATAMRDGPGQRGDGSDRFAVRLLATVNVGGTELTLPVRVARLFIRARVRLGLSLNGEAPYLSELRFSFVDEPELDLGIEFGPVRPAPPPRVPRPEPSSRTRLRAPSSKSSRTPLRSPS